MTQDQRAAERQITRGPGGKILTNTGVWSPDGQWIVYDTRSDPAGDRFDGKEIRRVNVLTGEVQTLFKSSHGAFCGVATYHPKDPRVVFILGPENPTPDWQYNAWHRQGVIVNLEKPGEIERLDARDIQPPFTAGALRGGSHVHLWDAAGNWVSFTYEDHVLAEGSPPSGNVPRQKNARNIGVAVPGRPVMVSNTHPRNHSGSHFSVLVTSTVNVPRPRSDEISRAFEEGWIGTNGYLRPDASRQHRALAFIGLVADAAGKPLPEVYVADLPQDITKPGPQPLQGTEFSMPAPPAGVTQRRLTRTESRRFPGICASPRHWLRTSPDGTRIAFIMKDDSGIAQLWTVSPNGGEPQQLTRNPHPIASAFTWNLEGTLIAHTMDGSVCITSAANGQTTRVTSKDSPLGPLRPEACVFSPNGRHIAYVREVPELEGKTSPGAGPRSYNQICVVKVFTK